MQIVTDFPTPPARRPSRLRRVAQLGLVASASVLSACTSFADMLTPGQRNADVAPAMLSFQANVALASNHGGATVDLGVLTTYLRADGSEVPISTQSMRLLDAELQPVPIPVDIGPCLADPARDGNNGSCAVMLSLVLQVNQVIVDRQRIGPIRLTPGLPATLPNAVTLFEIAEVTLLDTDGTPLAATLSLPPGATRALSARVRDSRGATVTDRTVTWRSDAPQVASISSTGVITAIAEGTARFTATLGELSASVSATIVRPPVALTIAPAMGSGRGTVRSTPAGIDCRVSEGTTSGTCTATFPAAAQVTLRSVADARHQFALWGDACAAAGSSAQCEVTLDVARQASVRFHAVRTLTIAARAESDGQGRITGTGLDCRLDGSSVAGTCTLDVIDGTEVALSATTAGVAARQRFAGWSGACAAGTSDACTIMVRGGDALVSAGFFNARPLSVLLEGAGGGAVLGVPQTECLRTFGSPRGECATSVEHGTVVTLSVAPDARSEFSGWSGACTGSAPTCTVALTTARSVTATFSPRRVALTVLATGTGAGVVQLNGEPFCTRSAAAADTECTRVVDAGTQLVLRGTASGTLSRFDGFSGACSGTSDCTLRLDESQSVRAEFALVPVSISVVSTGTSTGSGRIVIEGEGSLDCTITLGTIAPSGCSRTVNPLAPLQLVARPAANSALLAWGEACAGATTITCTVTPSAPTMVSARFTAAIDVQMIMARSGGAGTVSFSIPGVPTQPTCSSVASVLSSCRYSLPIGATGVFRGVPAGSNRFVGFRGPCLEGAGPVPVCTYRGFGFVREIEAVFER